MKLTIHQRQRNIEIRMAAYEKAHNELVRWMEALTKAVAPPAPAAPDGGPVK